MTQQGTQGVCTYDIHGSVQRLRFVSVNYADGED